MIYRKTDIPVDLQQYFVRAEIGLEATPDEYVAKLVAVFREVRRVLRDDGTYWVHIDVVDPVNTIASRIDYVGEASREHGIPQIPAQDHVKHMALRVANKVPHFDPDA